MDEKNCEFHGTVMEKINNTAEKVSDMKEDLELFKKEVRDDIQSIKIVQAKDEEKFITIFADMKEIKQYLKEIAEEIKKTVEKQQNKPDLFKDTLIKIGMEVLEYALIGGILFYILQTGKLISK
jgi:predicted RND superfamily exporter protein